MQMSCPSCIVMSDERGMESSAFDDRGTDATTPCNHEVHYLMHFPELSLSIVPCGQILG